MPRYLVERTFPDGLKLSADDGGAEICRVVKVNGNIWLTLHPFSKVARMLVQDVSRLDFPRAAYRLYVTANLYVPDRPGRRPCWPR